MRRYSNYENAHPVAEEEEEPSFSLSNDCAIGYVVKVGIQSRINVTSKANQFFVSVSGSSRIEKPK